MEAHGGEGVVFRQIASFSIWNFGRVWRLEEI